MQDSAGSRVASREPLAASSGHAVSDSAAAGFVAALSLESADAGELRSVERCTEAACGQRTADVSLLRRVHGLVGPDPPDRLELGQCSWAVLHTSAARFPMKPTEEQRNKMQSWVDAFLKLYPCGECRAHMAPYVKDHPIEAQDSARLSEWLCKAHNYVNADLGKDLFLPCDGTALRSLYGGSRTVRRPDLS